MSMAGPRPSPKHWATEGRPVHGIPELGNEAAGVACVQTNDDRFDIVHLLMTPDQRDPDVVVRSERGLLDIVAAQAPPGTKVRLSAPAAEALLSSASELGLVGVEGGASVKDKLAREDAKLTDERYRDVDWLDREA